MDIGLWKKGDRGGNMASREAAELIEPRKRTPKAAPMGASRRRATSFFQSGRDRYAVALRLQQADRSRRLTLAGDEDRQDPAAFGREMA
jgi:hypothetical protein